ncbi:Got1-like family protein [Colletotrichum tofieldiae]|nr:Got1-like family protein [Colletotrichum tofieldiae]GKT85307.1 GOT1-like family protein [Colletotrichum tofieldiae]
MCVLSSASSHVRLGAAELYDDGGQPLRELYFSCGITADLFFRNRRDFLLRRLAMGNILFLIGLTIIIGPQKTLLFFARKQKAKGTAAFFAGLALILLRWPLIGFCVELYGIMVLFGDFLGTIAAFARNIPVIGPYIGAAVDRSGVGRRNAELPV